MIYKEPNWDDTGLLMGLTEHQKRLCRSAFSTALKIMMSMNVHIFSEEENSFIISNKNKSVVQIKPGLITMRQMMMLFRKQSGFDLRLDIVLFPIIRRIVEKNIEVDVKRLIQHCRTGIVRFDPSKYRHDTDLEAECCAFLADNYR